MPAAVAALGDEWTYLREVVRGKTPIDPLLSLDTNLIVAEILDTARAQIAAQSALNRAVDAYKPVKTLTVSADDGFGYQ